MMEPGLSTLLRGPLLVGTVLLSLLFPYFIQLSLKTVVCISFLCIGVILTLHDATHFLHHKARHKLVVWLDTIVLDDVLRTIFDPQTGLIAIVISCFVGNASMYALPMSTDQRVRLVNSCLWTTPEQARVILTSPGGLKELFPKYIQQWLEADEKEETKHVDFVKHSIADASSDDGDDLYDDENSDQASEETNEAGGPPATPTRGIDGEFQRNLLPTGIRMPSMAPSSPTGSTTFARGRTKGERERFVQEEDPLQVLGAVFKDIMLRSVKQLVPSGVSDSVVPAIGVTVTAIVLWSRFRSAPSHSSRIRHTLVSVLTGAVLATLWSKSTSDSIRDLAVAGPTGVVSERLASLLRMLVSPKARKLKVGLAFFVLWYASRRRQQVAGPYPSRRPGR